MKKSMSNKRIKFCRVFCMAIVFLFTLTFLQTGAYAAGPTLDVNHTSPAILKGNSIQIVPSLKNGTSSIKSKSFKTSNKKVASVTAAGTVKGIKSGTATITVNVKTKSGDTLSKKVKVTVKNSVARNTSYVTSTDNVNIKKGNSYQVKPALKNSTSSITGTSYKISNSKIASITKSGTVKGKKGGTVTVTMTSKTKDKQTLIKKIKVIVKNSSTAKTPDLNISGKKTILKGNSAALKPALKNSKSSIKSSTFSSSNKKIATVSSKGVVNGVKAGTATIKVTSRTKDNHTIVKSTKITVKSSKAKDTSYISVSPTSVSLKTGAAKTIKTTLKNSSSSISSTAYSSSKKSVATVSSAGKITAISPGSAAITVTAKTKNGETLTASVKVSVTYTPNVDAIEDEVLKLINAERKKLNRTSLTHNSKLRKGSKIRAKELVTLFDHSRPGGREWYTIFDEVGYTGYYTAGENVLYRTNTSSSDKAAAKTVYEQWKASSGHYQNMISSSFNEIGIGVYIKNGNLYAAQLFGGR